MAPNPLPRMCGTTAATRRSIVTLVACALASAGGKSNAQDQRPIKFVYGDNLPPHSYLDGGVLRGGLPRVIDELLHKRLKIQVSHHVYPWARAQAMVQQGTADAFVGAVTPERLMYSVVTDEWLAKARLSAFVNSRNATLPRYQSLQTVAGLSSFKLGSVRGNQWVESVLGHQQLNHLPGRELAFKMLMTERIEILVDVSGPTRLALQAENLEADIQELPLVIAQEEVRICVGKHSPLRARLRDMDESIRAMREDGSMARLFKN